MAAKKKGAAKAAPKKSKKPARSHAPAPKKKPTAKAEKPKATAKAVPPAAPPHKAARPPGTFTMREFLGIDAPPDAKARPAPPPKAGGGDDAGDAPFADLPPPGPLPPPEEIPACADKDARVDWIYGVMLTNRWPEPAKGTAALFREKVAAAWGIEECTVRAYAAEASRRVKLDPELREQQTIALLNRFLALADQAAVERNMTTGLPDFGSAIKALERFADFSGITPEHKVKLTGTVTLDDLDALRRRVTGDDEEDGPGGSAG